MEQRDVLTANEEDSIPLSDIESLSASEVEDIVPHQRLTINNNTALLKAYRAVAITPHTSFSEHQAFVSSNQTEITDVHDDLTRELAFVKQALGAAVDARDRLLAEGVPFSRPRDFFAEMVKNDEHMEKIKKKVTEDAASRMAAADARKQRQLKKFGKQVQVAKMQERSRAKREMLDRIDQLKRKRRGTELTTGSEADLFDIRLENEPIAREGSRRKSTGDGNAKRRMKDAKFGFGGRKRHLKSGDAFSSGDLSGFSVKRMKGQQRINAKRLGKSRRAKAV